jgi:hypothetical protein
VTWGIVTETGPSSFGRGSSLTQVRKDSDKRWERLTSLVFHCRIDETQGITAPQCIHAWVCVIFACFLYFHLLNTSAVLPFFPLLFPFKFFLPFLNGVQPRSFWKQRLGEQKDLKAGIFYPDIVLKTERTFLLYTLSSPAPSPLGATLNAKIWTGSDIL